jgi:hypothetical protein
MRPTILLVVILLCSTVVPTQGTDSNLRSDLESLHAKWFKAFDGATMDQMEMEKLVLVMPTGFIWSKPAPRAGEQAPHATKAERTLTDVSVRRFGDTAILTGVLNSKSADDNSSEPRRRCLFATPGTGR